MHVVIQAPPGMEITHGPCIAPDGFVPHIPWCDSPAPLCLPLWAPLDSPSPAGSLPPPSKPPHSPLRPSSRIQRMPAVPFRMQAMHTSPQV